MKTHTTSTKSADIERQWRMFDVKGKALGRAATQVAKLLMGKSKPYFVRHLDCGDYVVVINAQKISISGNKAKQKIYTTYSGYPGGLKKETFEQLHKRRPEEIIRHAVYGMLPKNKLRARMIQRLYIYKDESHPYSSKVQEKIT